MSEMGECLGMNLLEEIHVLPLNEKMRVMEALWSEISQTPGQIEVPQWHQDILDERDRLLEEGKAVVLDWDEVKKKLLSAAP